MNTSILFVKAFTNQCDLFITALPFYVISMPWYYTAVTLVSKEQNS